MNNVIEGNTFTQQIKGVSQQNHDLTFCYTTSDLVISLGFMTLILCFLIWNIRKAFKGG